MSEPWSYETSRELARTSGVEGLQHAADIFLVKGASAGREDEGPIAFRTAHVNVADDGQGAVPDWVIRPLRKRPGNPFPERFSVGRAPNCDVVLRFRFVSKLHAHIFESDSKLVLADNGSANGTWVNGIIAPARERIPLRAGDEVRFGIITMTVMAPPTLFALLVGAPN